MDSDAAQLSLGDPMLARVIADSPVGLAVFDQQMRYVAVSERFLTDLGVPAGRPVIGQSHYDVFPEIPDRWRELHRRALAGETLSSEKDAFDRADGSTDWVRWVLKPWREADGRIGGLALYSEVITPRVAAQLDLQAAEARYRAVFNQAAVGVALLSPEGRFLEVNDRYCQIAGYPKEERQALTFEQITHPDDVNSDWDQARALLAGRIQTYSMEKRYLRKGGELVWINLTVSLVRRPDGEPDYFVAVIEDIDLRKRAEAARQDSEERFRLMANVLPQIMWITDAEGRREFFNRQWTDYTGNTDAPETADGVAESYVHPDDQAITMARFEEARRVGKTFEVEHRIRSAAGEYRWFLVRGEPYRDPRTGEILQWFGTSVDIHDRRLMEAALRESEEDYRHAAELNPQVAWTAQPDGQLDRVAPRWMEWTGSSGLGATYTEALHPDDVRRTLEVWGRSVATGEPYDIVHRVQLKTGEHRWIRSRAYPRRDEQGNIVRWYGTTEDIHEQKTAEDHLRLMVLELNHRVKNNLATVQSIAFQTLRGAESTAEAREAFLQRITALAAAHDVLTREQWEGVSLREVAHGVLDALSGAGGRVRMEGPRVALTSKNALSLSMAFHELGTNALKYGALNRSEGVVDLTWTSDGSRLAIEWRERGGPAVRAPERRGFGSRLLERGVAAELNGEVDLRFEADGLVCRIAAPLPADGSA